MKLLVKRFGIYIMMLLYSFILIPFGNEQIPLLKGSEFITEMTEGSSSDLSSVKIYYNEFEGQLKVFSENEESNKYKKNQEKQYFTVSKGLAFIAIRFRSKGVKNNLEICNSQTDFNFVAHSFW